jgi:7-carboxy-7-deazaguanine synthase
MGEIQAIHGGGWKMKVYEIFASIQGEGRYAGVPQIFIRLTGCNLRCSWCDTKKAQTQGTDMSQSEIMEKAKYHSLKSVCITGGEPLFQVMESQMLVRELKKKGYEIVLETNGTLYDREIFETVDCVSMDMKPPSSGMSSDESLLKYLHEKDQVKIVVKDEKDLEYAKRILGKTEVEVYLMPDAADMKWVSEEVIREGLNARVMPQLHKIWGLK